MQGSCLCGEVRFEIIGDMPNLYQCHCSLCRKVSGSASSSAFIVEETNFKWIQGAERVGKYSKPSGYSSHFCTRCGSPTPNHFMARYYWVPVGTLDGNPDIRIVAHLFMDSKCHWDVPSSDAAQYKQALALDVLIATLRE